MDSRDRGCVEVDHGALEESEAVLAIGIRNEVKQLVAFGSTGGTAENLHCIGEPTAHAVAQLRGGCSSEGDD